MRQALLLVGHGSKSSQADDVLPYYVEALRSSGKFCDVQACYLEREPSVEGALDRIDADRIYVMPLLLAHGHHTRVTIPQSLGISGTQGVVNGKEVLYLEPLGRSEHIVALISDRINETQTD